MFNTMIKTLTIAGLTTLALAYGAAKADGRPCHPPGGPNPYLPQSTPAPAWGWQPSPGADRWSDRIDARQERQMQLIRYGMHTGQLTPREAHRLMEEQRAIERMQRQFLADGHLSLEERKRLEMALLEARFNIRAQLYDRPHHPRW